MSRVSRRSLLAWSGAAGVVGAAGGVAAERATTAGPQAGTAPSTASDARRLGRYDVVVRDSQTPMGLDAATPAFGHVLALDLTDAARSNPSRARSGAITLLTSLNGVVASSAARHSAASLDIRPANLQVTPGVGATLLEACDLRRRRPSGLVDVPRFATDRLRPQLTGGDLLVQLGADDPMRLAGAFQAVLGLLRGTWRVRWSRPGFRPTPAGALRVGETPRNLMGHRDGTANPDLGSALWRSTVLVDGDGWMSGGSYVVARQILIDLEDWFDHPEATRDATIGRHTVSGAALGQHREHQPVNLDARTGDGEPVVPSHAHIRLASTRNSLGARIFRRSWNFDDGYLAADRTADRSADRSGGTRHAGLMFMAWQADIERGFIPIQRSLTTGGDSLNDFVTHIGSAVFAVPARGRDAYAGQSLMEG